MPDPAPPVLLADRVCQARRSGRCAMCGGGWISVGEHIGRVNGKWSHLACIIARQRAAAPVTGDRAVTSVLRSL